MRTPVKLIKEVLDTKRNYSASKTFSLRMNENQNFPSIAGLSIPCQTLCRFLHPITSVPQTKLAAAHQQGSPVWDGRTVQQQQQQQQIWVCPWMCPSLHMRSYVSNVCLCVCGSGRVPCFLNVMFLKLFWLRGAPQTSELGGGGTPQLAPQRALSPLQKGTDKVHYTEGGGGGGKSKTV